MNGFFVNWLRLTGPEVKAAEVRFEPGLNVIWGASETGKSLIFSCIDFMLGGSKPPKKIEELKGYESAWLAITLRNTRERFILERGIRGGEFNLHSTKPDSWEIADIKTLLAEHNPDRIDTISHMLLAASGLEEAIILTRKDRGVTRSISFRDVAHMTFVNEVRIIDERAPVYPTGQRDSLTGEMATFSYLISGQDWKGLIAAPDTKVQRATWRGKNELYEQLIAELKTEVGEDPPSSSQLAEKIATIDVRIVEVNSKIEESSQIISTMMGTRQRSWEDAQKARTRLAVIGQLQDRFEQLRQHYKSDMDRLQFIAEGDFFLAQLGMPHCPFCGDPLEQHSAARLREEAANGSIQEAAAEEVRKISANLRDLEDTMKSLSGERGQLGTHLSQHERAISQAEKSIRNELEPRVVGDKKELAELVELRGKLVAQKSSIDRLSMLTDRHLAIGKEPRQKRKGAPPKPSPNPDPGSLYHVANEITEILRSWRYMKDGSVTFDDEMDLVVNGEPRRNRGKGIRAVLHSAFTLGVMNHCGRSSLSHTGFVMLDSPLTSYKEKDYMEVSEDIKIGFFESLLRMPQRLQVIIFENKEPPADIVDLLPGKRFTGSDSAGRKGFIP
jgi:AAA domain